MQILYFPCVCVALSRENGVGASGLPNRGLARRTTAGLGLLLAAYSPATQDRHTRSLPQAACCLIALPLLRPPTRNDRTRVVFLRQDTGYGTEAAMARRIRSDCQEPVSGSLCGSRCRRHDIAMDGLRTRQAVPRRCERASARRCTFMSRKVADLSEIRKGPLRAGCHTDRATVGGLGA